MPNGGWRVVADSLKAYGYTPDEKVGEIFTKYRKTHNDGVFDGYTPEIRKARSSGIVTGLPDAYGRGRIVGINWTMPLSANKVLFNLGLTLFLANAGMSTGANVVSTVAQNGVMILVLGAAVLFAIVLPVIVLGLFVFRMSYDEMAGVLAGATGNPAILAYANKLAPTDRPDVGYAMIFPSMTILKILFVNIAAALV